MRNTRNRSTLWTFSLAFAIVLAPALMQEDVNGCSVEPGETRLEVLHVAGLGEDLIAFDPDERIYDVMLAEEPGTLLIQALSMDPEAGVSYAMSDGCETVVVGELPTGGGMFTLESLPEGHSVLNILVQAPGLGLTRYAVFFAQLEQCP